MRNVYLLVALEHGCGVYIKDSVIIGLFYSLEQAKDIKNKFRQDKPDKYYEIFTVKEDTPIIFFPDIEHKKKIFEVYIYKLTFVKNTKLLHPITAVSKDKFVTYSNKPLKKDEVVFEYYANNTKVDIEIKSNENRHISYVAEIATILIKSHGILKPSE